MWLLYNYESERLPLALHGLLIVSQRTFVFDPSGRERLCKLPPSNNYFSIEFFDTQLPRMKPYLTFFLYRFIIKRRRRKKSLAHVWNWNRISKIVNLDFIADEVFISLMKANYKFLVFILVRSLIVVTGSLLVSVDEVFDDCYYDGQWTLNFFSFLSFWV